MPWVEIANSLRPESTGRGDAVLAGSNTPSPPSASLNTHFVTGKAARPCTPCSSRTDRGAERCRRPPQEIARRASQPRPSNAKPTVSRPFRPHRVVNLLTQGIGLRSRPWAPFSRPVGPALGVVNYLRYRGAWDGDRTTGY